MSTILGELLTQTCVYWAKGTTPQKNGELGWVTPVELPCKWVPGTRKIQDENGRTVNVEATVYLSTEVLVEGALILGSFSDLGLTEPYPTQPTSNKYEIQVVRGTPATDDDETLWEAGV